MKCDHEPRDVDGHPDQHGQRHVLHERDEVDRPELGFVRWREVDLQQVDVDQRVLRVAATTIVGSEVAIGETVILMTLPFLSRLKRLLKVEGGAAE